MTMNQEAIVLMLVAGSAWGFVRLMADACVGAVWILRKIGPKGQIMAWHYDPTEPAEPVERDWPVEILTLAADIVDENGRATFGADEAKAIRAVLDRLTPTDPHDVCDRLDDLIAAWVLEGRDTSLLVHTVVAIRRAEAEKAGAA